MQAVSPLRVAGCRALAVLLALALPLSACSLLKNEEPPALTNINALEPGSPFALEVERVVNTAGQVHVFGHVKALTEWPAKEVMIRLSGYKMGERVREMAKPLNQAAPPAGKSAGKDKTLPAGSIPFYITLPAEGLSDIEVGLFWGEEASSIIPSSKQELSFPVELANLVVKEQREACSEASCPSRFVVTFELRNIGDSTIDTIVLGVSYVAQGQTPLAGSADNEERLPLAGLALAKGEKRDIKLNFQSPLPAEISQKLEPAVRILDAK